MGMHVAILGKGGSGKSVVAGTLARVLARSGHEVLTLDSDMMPGLALSLGLGLDASAMLTDAVEKNDQGRWRLRKGIGPVRAVKRYSVLAPDGVRHLQCGKLGPAGQPAIMASVNGYYQVIHRLPRSRTFQRWTIIGDLPAGPRQLAYRWAPFADTFVLMVEPSWKSALTARRIAAILRSTPGASVLPVASKVTGASDRRAVEKMLGEPVVTAIPADRAVAIAERAGLAPIDHAPGSPAVRAIETLAATLEARSDVSGHAA
ncbi:MAG: nucleotide-binding protein [Solirubrobacteraceae bacterium]